MGWLSRDRRRRRAGASVALAALLLCLIFSQAQAAGPSSSPRDKFRAGNTITIPAGETVPHDLYVWGGNVRIDGRIDGDLFVAGGTVDLTGPVSGDLFVVGGAVTISSSVGRHLRVLGGNVTVSGPVKQDLLAAAGTLDLATAARVGGDLIFTAGRMTLDGAVDGSVLGSTQNYTNNGSIGGSEEVTLRQAPSKPAPPSLLSRFLGQVRRYVSIVVVGALLLALAPRLLPAAATRMRERPLPALGIGVLSFIGFFAVLLGLLIGVVILAILLGLLGLGQLVLTVVIGVLLGMGVLSYLFALVLLFIAAAVVGLILGRLAFGWLTQPWARGPYPALLLGVLVIVVLTALPLIGWVINALVVLFGLGALVMLLRPSRLMPAPALDARPGIGRAD